MKKILLSLFGIITLGLINFSSAGTYNYSGNVVLSNGTCNTNNNYCQFTYNLSIPVDDIVNFNTNRASCVLSNFSSSLNSSRTNAIKFYYLTKQNGRIQTMSSSSQTLTVGNTINYDSTDRVGVPVYLAFQLYTIDGINELSFDFNCNFTGYNIINQTSLSTCQSDLSTCQSDLTTCQNSSSSCSPSGQCTVSDKVSENILFSGSKSFNTSYSNMFDYGIEGAGTYCLKFTSNNPQTLTMGFANGPTTTPTNLYSLYNDQYGNTICLYGNKPYLNVKLNASSNTIDYEVYKLTDLLSDDIPCGSSSESCDYSDYESQINTLSGNLATCEGMYDRLESDYDLLEGNYNTCTSELSSCLENGGSFGSGDIQWSSLFINNIQHLGNENIFITIPEYLKFSYTNEGDDFELEVVGLEQDEEYLSGVINKLNYIPTTEDFSNVFSNFGLFGGLLVVCLFVIFVFYIIKKIFS